MSVQMRVRLPSSIAPQFTALPTTARAVAVGAVLVSAVDGVNLVALLGAVEELRRLSVNLNQLTRLSHARGALDGATIQRVTEVVEMIERLRGRG